MFLSFFLWHAKVFCFSLANFFPSFCKAWNGLGWELLLCFHVKPFMILYVILCDINTLNTTITYEVYLPKPSVTPCCKSWHEDIRSSCSLPSLLRHKNILGSLQIHSAVCHRQGRHPAWSSAVTPHTHKNCSALCSEFGDWTPHVHCDIKHLLCDSAHIANTVMRCQCSFTVHLLHCHLWKAPTDRQSTTAYSYDHVFVKVC